MTLPHIEVTSDKKRISLPPTVRIDGEVVPGVVSVLLEHPPQQFAYVTLTIATDKYKLNTDGLISNWRAEQIRRRRMKRRAKRVFI